MQSGSISFAITIVVNSGIVVETQWESVVGYERGDGSG